MNRLFAAAAVLTIALTGCGFRFGDTSAVDQFLGKSLVSDSGDTFTFSSDGSITGQLRGEPVIGTYTATSSEVCTSYTAPDFLNGQQFCSTPDIDGNRVIFNRRDGSQSQPYTILG